jgi:hypothetical protein
VARLVFGVGEIPAISRIQLQVFDAVMQAVDRTRLVAQATKHERG